MQVSRISKIAGFSLLGFAAAAIVADKVNLNPVLTQVAEFAGALAGSFVAKRRESTLPAPEPKQPEPEPASSRER